MIEWPLIFLGGLLGSSHCVGMCGGFVITLGATQPRLSENLRRQIAYALGRVFTYSVAGAAAGYGGWRLAYHLQPLINVQAILFLVAGGLLIIQGLLAAGVLSFPWPASTSCPGARSFAGLLRTPGLGVAFIAGLLNGLIPCGLVYAYLALAISTGTLVHGLLTMAVFGLGTLPVMVILGCGSSLLSLHSRRRLFQIAAWCIVLTGVLSVYRAVVFIQRFGLIEPSGCPLCH
jgi:sulfite exporter TauE/SafE